MKRLIFSIRSIRKNIKLNMFVLLSMALGLLSTGIILSHVYQEFHYDVAHPGSERIYKVVKEGAAYAPLAQTLKDNFPEIENSVRVSFFYGYLACATTENKFNETSAIFADPQFFSFFSFPLVSGNPQQCLDAPNSIVISQTAAQKYFGDKDPVGKPLKIGKEREFIVTAVYRDFAANSNFRSDLILPLQVISKLTQIWIEPGWEHESDIHTFVLLSENVDVKSLVNRIGTLISGYNAQLKERPGFLPLKDLHIEQQFVWESTAQVNVSYLYVLIVIAILILFISSANFLFLFIGIKSRQSISSGIKKVCGASRQALFFEFFVEAFLLMIFSLLLALVFYTAYQDLITGYFSFLPQIIFFDFKLLLILIAGAVIVVIVSGGYPALILSRQMPALILGAQKKSRKGKTGFVNKLVVAQFTLCIALIAGTYIMHEQVSFMENRDTGYAKDELLTIPLNMHIGDGIYNEKFEAFTRELKNYPGIKNVSMAFSSPSSVITSGDTPPDWQGKSDGQHVEMYWESVSFDYFKTIGVEIILGRDFSRDFPADVINWDTRTGAYILNQSAVKAMGIENPVGKEFSVWGFKGPVIGVVEDYNFQSLRSRISPMFYQMNPFFLNEIVVRVNPNSTSALADIKHVWQRFVPGYPLEFHFVSDKIRHMYNPEQTLADTLNVFSFIAIIIAVMGLFALTLLSINKRVKEIGIRKVLGASVTAIVYLLSKDFLKRVVLANVIAWPLAWLAMNAWLQSFAYRVEMSGWIFLLAGGLALAIALLTVSWQAVRAATANPVESLRYE